MLTGSACCHRLHVCDNQAAMLSVWVDSVQFCTTVRPDMHVRMHCTCCMHPLDMGEEAAPANRAHRWQQGPIWLADISRRLLI
jgi:hypothetical protein